MKTIEMFIQEHYNNKYLYEVSHLIHLYETIVDDRNGFEEAKDKLYNTVNNIKDFLSKNKLLDKNMNKTIADLKLKINKDNPKDIDLLNIRDKVNLITHKIKRFFPIEKDIQLSENSKENYNNLKQLNEKIIEKIVKGKKVKYYTPFQGPVLYGRNGKSME